MALFGRKLRLSLNDLLIEDLDCTFKVKKTLKREPNTAEISVYNLSKASRKALETSQRVIVRLEAGYQDEPLHQIYFGEVRYSASKIKDADVITDLITGDSEKEIQKARIQVPIGAGTPPSVALESIARALGVRTGNLARAKTKLDQKGRTLFPVHTVISGSTSEALDAFCKSAGLEWSIQDGQLQVLDRNAYLDETAVLISSDTGMVGSPSVDIKGHIQVTTLLAPDLNPGRKIVVKAEGVSGNYRIDEVSFEGDTAGLDWYAKITGKVY